MTTQIPGFEEFLGDIAPFFYQRSVTYVDLGAYDGETFEQLVRSKLKIREAHLVEPNIASLNLAKQRLAKQFTGTLKFHNVAMGSERRRVWMSSAKNMTKVLKQPVEPSPPPAADSNFFEVDCWTLDSLAEQLTERRISLLKIDVEGYEEEVLLGATALLHDQRIDMVYVEAGMNPSGTQQCYYRTVEDILLRFGYRIFRIYEQQFEWLDDSPLLRRINLAFMSPRFADANPFRLTRELRKTQRELAQSKQQAETAAQHVVDLEHQCEALRRDAATDREKDRTELTNRLEKAFAERSQLQLSLAEALKDQEERGARNKEAIAKLAVLENAVREATEARAKTELVVAGLRSSGARKDGEISRLIESQSKAQRELESVQAELNSKNGEMISSRAALDSSNEDLELARHKLNATKSDLKSAQAESESIKQELAASRMRLISAEEELASARQELESIKAELALAQGELESLGAASNANNAALATLQSTLDSLALQRDADARASVKLSERLEAARAAQVKLANERRALRSKVVHAEGQQRNADSTIAGFLEVVTALQKRIVNTQEEHASTRRDLSRLSRSRVYRVAKAIADGKGSVGGWLNMPRALRLACVKIGRPERSPQSDFPPLDLQGLNCVLLMALLTKSQSVIVPRTEQATEVWIESLSTESESASVIQVSFKSAVPVERRSLVVGRPEKVQLSGGKGLRILRREGGEPEVILNLRNALNKTCVIRLELRAASVTFPEGNKLKGVRTATQPRKELLDESDPKPGTTQFSSNELEDKLWGGYASYALVALEARKSGSAAAAEKESAAWSLARWYYVEEDFDRALDNVKFMKRVTASPQRRTYMLEAQCLIRLSRYVEADRSLVAAMGKYPGIARNLELLRSTVARRLAMAQNLPRHEVDLIQLEAINVAYRRAKMAPIEKRHADQPLSIGNITAKVGPKIQDQTRKVSVVVPCFNAESSIEWVIDGLLEQTWKNLEILVVDDRSTDRSCEIVARISQRDARVRLIQQPLNSGAYPARNAGARAATGRYVTVHDSDDWSHPEKIERQIGLLDASPGKAGVISHWVRVDEHLEMLGPWRPKGSLFDVNFSSLLVERELLQRMRFWDEVKISGDAEFYYRLKSIYGQECVAKLPTEFLTSLSLTREDSLTRAKATHLRTLNYGLRWNYRDAYLSWDYQVGVPDDGAVLRDESGGRKFPMPLGCVPQNKGKGNVSFDLVVVADFAEAGHDVSASVGRIRRACLANQRVGVFHWRSYLRASQARLSSDLYEAYHAHPFEILSPGDGVTAKLVIVFDPSIAEYLIEPHPGITATGLIAVKSRQRVSRGSEVSGLTETARHNLTVAFGVEPVYVDEAAVSLIE